MRSRWLVAGATAVMVAAALVPHDDLAPTAAPTAAPTVSPVAFREPAAPAGTRWLITRGVGVAVPIPWWTGSHTCGSPEEDAVIVEDDDGDGDCAGGLVPHLNVVRTGWGWRRAVVNPSATDVVVDGVAARRVTGQMADRVYGMHSGSYVETLEVPSRGAVILLMTDDTAVAKRVLDTARAWHGTDPRGCPIFRDDLYATAPPQRPGARDVVVPPGAREASVCRYKYGVALTSRRIGPNRAAELAGVLNAAPRGLEPRDEFRSAHAVVATFRYASGPDVVVFVHWYGPRDKGANNGAVSATLTAEVFRQLRAVVGVSDVNEGRLVVPK